MAVIVASAAGLPVQTKIPDRGLTGPGTRANVIIMNTNWLPTTHRRESGATEIESYPYWFVFTYLPPARLVERKGAAS
jgi:hypothetical protein